jgi:hypothetical protein
MNFPANLRWKTLVVPRSETPSANPLRSGRERWLWKWVPQKPPFLTKKRKIKNEFFFLLSPENEKGWSLIWLPLSCSSSLVFELPGKRGVCHQYSEPNSNSNNLCMNQIFCEITMLFVMFYVVVHQCVSERERERDVEKKKEKKGMKWMKCVVLVSETKMNI